jgi:hypothetical protein
VQDPKVLRFFVGGVTAFERSRTTPAAKMT